MDSSLNFSLVQLILAWTLLGFLLIWMVVFALLALRPHSHETPAEETIHAASQPLTGISTLMPTLHMITSSSSQSAETANVESPVASEVVVRS